MGFDWKSFATGFMETTAENIKERKAEAREYEQKQKDLAERNLVTISKRRAVANQVVGLTNMLRENGASDTVIQAAIASGPKQVAELAKKVEQAKSTLGRKLGPADIETLVSVPDNFSPIDMDTEAFINQTYGLGYEGRGVGTTEKPELSFMDRLTGRKQMDLARAKLDSEVMQNGLTAYDINQIAAQQDYESLVPGTFVSFNDLKVFNPATDMSDFTRTMSNLVKDVQDSAEFEQIQEDIQQTTFSEDLDEEQKAARIAELQKQRDALYLRTVAPTIDSMVSMYGETFVDATSGYLRGFLSDDYVDSLMLEPEDQEPGVTPTTTVGTQTEEVLSEPATATSVTTPEVTVSELPDAEVTEEEPTTEVVEPVTTETEVPEDTADDQGVTYAEWKDMSRSEREEKGYPTSLLGGQTYFKRFAVGLGLVEDDARFEPKPQEEPEAETPVEAQAEEVEAVELEPDDMSIALLNSSDSTDLMMYMKDKGVTSEEEMAIAINEWAQENSKPVPLDKSVLIYAMKRYVLEQ